MKFVSLSKIIAFALAMVILGSSLGIMVAIASDKPDETQDPVKKVEEWEAKQEELKNKKLGHEVKDDNRSFYELSYDRATDEQRDQLDVIFADRSLGSIGEWRRDVLITLGDLPADTPRLTARDAAELYGHVEYEDMDDEFNKIAGAPDWVGGSGIGRSVYYLNDERTEAIYLIFGDVRHIVYNEDGTRTTLPIGNQILPPEPGPSPTLD